jgi:hypothetical protein
MHSGFFRLKHSPTIAKHKKTPYEKFLPGTILSKNSQVTMTTWSHGMLVPEGSKPKKNFYPKIV